MVVAAILVRMLLRLAIGAIFRSRQLVSVRLWARQVASDLRRPRDRHRLLSIWFDDPTRLTTAIGLVTAGLVFELQRVVTAIADMS